ncbi:MAG: hypothetical protein EBV06_03170 [Planctomycetia bacterium]|nr:hypothetical protein [Planctomycetia bacterium]
MTTMMMDRTGMTSTNPMMTPTNMPTQIPGVPNWMMTPRCTFKFEKCTAGMKMLCDCDDATARSMMQNLCTMLRGGTCSICCMMNGMMVCCCNLTMGMCKIEMTSQGFCLTCTSGDEVCCKMIQSCCDCLCTMMKAGCTGCFLMNNTPVCCG